MKYILRIVYYILFFVLASVLFLLIYNFICLKILKKDYTNVFGYTMFEIASGSMSPTLETNDLVIVKLGDKINVDDIITYKKDNAYITHRVVMLKGDSYICRGDANNTNDEPVKKDIVLGKVVKHLPKVGRWKIFFTTPKVIISIIITVILFELAFTYKKTNKFSDFSISGKKIIEEFGDSNEE